MRLAISNIAWDPIEDEEIALLLQHFHIDAIDIAPGKYFKEPIKATEEDIIKVKNFWLNLGFEITGMQSLLFGLTDLNLFGPAEMQDKMLKHLSVICHIGSMLGAKKLVFGSPKNRDRQNLNDQETKNIAVSFFNRLGDMALLEKVIICLEPNPTLYGANFMTTSFETANVVKAIKHPAIKMQLDTGALTINNENSNEILEKYADLIGHIHISEPNLLPLGNGTSNHPEINLALKKYLPRHVATIEMLATKNEIHKASIERALKTAIHYYRNEKSEI